MIGTPNMNPCVQWSYHVRLNSFHRIKIMLYSRLLYSKRPKIHSDINVERISKIWNDSIEWMILSFRFTVRDFTFDEKALANEREKIHELETERQKLYANLVRWLKIHFGEIFSASIHIKALRVFVESVLR